MRQVPQHTIRLFDEKKQAKEPITLITCYDYPSAQSLANTAIDAVLVGDSVAMVVHGHSDTLQADMPMMLLHTKAVARGLAQQFLIADLPFLEHRQGIPHAIRQSRLLLQAGAQAIKIEGGDAECCALIQALTTAGIPVMGHLGLTPQSLHMLGGFRVQGRDKAPAEQIAQQAKALEQAGCFALVLECVPATLAARISAQQSIPCIGIGAGPHTDGQILVWHDVLGLHSGKLPKFVQRFAALQEETCRGISDYAQAVKERRFPQAAHSYLPREEPCA
ncbi:MAG: 3-methyl-2-oxobutanoate hydroxymethyltransferase [Legionellaceae bacterium]|nr:3-methyl-2-oxobutanoate hydroxymethyltransferase [Legionellaceae bacterium]